MEESSFSKLFGFVPFSSGMQAIEDKAIRLKLTEIATPYHKAMEEAEALSKAYVNGGDSKNDPKVVLEDHKRAVALKAEIAKTGREFQQAVELVLKAGYRYSQDIDQFKVPATK